MSVKQIYNSVLEFNPVKVAELVKEDLSSGVDVTDILDNGLIAAMDEVGRRFGSGELFIPEMLRAAIAMKSGMQILKPLLTPTSVKNKGTVILGTVKGDLHDIGKNLVGMMLEGAGFQVIDLGVDIDKDMFVSAAIENKADIIGMSALLTTTMPGMKETVAVIKERGLSAKIMIGGAPVTDEFARQIGADAYASDAPSAVEKARNLLNSFT